ncbi:MAG: HNH endonuclease domain-containing protein [Erysipelotrichaceae bacterium]
MSNYIRMWVDIIEGMNNTNTYKLAWGRAILEIIMNVTIPSDNDIITIEFNNIAEKMLKYYWNQIFFFDLKQGPSVKPKIVNICEQLIENYKENEGSNIPVYFDYAYEELIKERANYDAKLNSISTTLTKDVAWRFKNVGDQTLPIYEYELKSKFIKIDTKSAIELKEYAVVLSSLLNFKWAQLLEQFNVAPKIASKVKGLSDSKLRRNNLTKYRNALLSEFEDNKPLDFYSGQILAEDEISVDHVIPWSFMYSDDIWNLVLTTKSNNSSKSNRIPTQETIIRLIERNKVLLNRINDEGMKKKLELANEHNYVNTFYTNMRL